LAAAHRMLRGYAPAGEKGLVGSAIVGDFLGAPTRPEGAAKATGHGLPR
jgi:hypothetical protein